MFKRALLPNLLTVGNLFLGFWAIMLISRDDYIFACWLIVLAMILDGLDGFVARLVHSNSNFGVEMDSLVDVVSFGVAPALLVYKSVLQQLGTIGLFLAFAPLLAGVLRLARYNVASLSRSGKKRFHGIPITAVAGLFVSLKIYDHALGGAVSQSLWFSLIPAVTLLMLSPIPYSRFPFIDVHRSKHPRIATAVLIIIALAVLWNPPLTLFPFGVVYLLSGPIGWGISHSRKLRVQQPDEEDDETSAIFPESDGQRFNKRTR